MSRIWILLLLTGCAGKATEARGKGPVVGAAPDAAIALDARGGTSGGGGASAGGCRPESCPTLACPPQRRFPSAPGECCERCMPCGVGPCPIPTLCPFGEALVVPDGECCAVCQPTPAGGVCDPDAAGSFVETESATLGLYSCREDADCTLRSLQSPCGGGCDIATNASVVDEYLGHLYEYARMHCVNCGLSGCSVGIACPIDGSACYPAAKGSRARCVNGQCVTATINLDGSEWIPGALDGGPIATKDCPLPVPTNDAPCGLQSGDVCFYGGGKCEGVTSARCQGGFWIVIPGVTIPCGPTPPPPPPPPTTTCPPPPGPIMVERCNYQGPPCTYGGDCSLGIRIAECVDGMWSLSLGPCMTPP